MLKSYENIAVLNIPGYEVYFTRFADSIVKDHFKDALYELEKVLNKFEIEEAQIVTGGGGLSTITQSLGKLLREENWIKKNIVSEHRVDGRTLSSESHEVDHYKSFDEKSLGLEIEWNNKDPFFDRDLENFRRLHQIGELNIGIIITRGQSLQDELYPIYERQITSMCPLDIDELQKKFDLSAKARSKIKKMLDLPEVEAINRISTFIFRSKFGQATTHMQKLLLRINRGVGNPCPLILIGIGKGKIRYTPMLF